MACCSCGKTSHHILFLPLHLTQSRFISDSDLVNCCFGVDQTCPTRHTYIWHVCMHVCIVCMHTSVCTSVDTIYVNNWRRLTWAKRSVYWLLLLLRQLLTNTPFSAQQHAVMPLYHIVFILSNSIHSLLIECSKSNRIHAAETHVVGPDHAVGGAGQCTRGRLRGTYWLQHTQS